MGTASIRVEAIVTYPVKSCGAVRHEAAELEAFGLAWDRRWMVVDTAGRFVTQRSHPRLALVRAGVGPSCLAVSAPGVEPLEVSLASGRRVATAATVWDHAGTGWDEGDAAAAWFSRWLGFDVRFVRFPDDAVRAVNPEYSPSPPAPRFPTATRCCWRPRPRWQN